MLSSDNDLGALARVKHPAGITFFQRDASGRLTALVQNEGSTVLGANMRVTEYTYTTLGALENIRYPSGRRVQYRYQTADVERPTEALIYVDPSGTSTINRIAGDISYDVDDVPIRWRWGQTGVGSDRWHNVIRDAVGRVTEVNDEENGVTIARLLYQQLDGDGDPLTIAENSTLRSVLTSSTTSSATTPIVWNLGFDSRDDLLVSHPDQFNIPGGQTPRSIVLDGTRRRRTSDTQLSTTSTYSYLPTTLEKLTARGTTTLAYAATGSATPADVTSIGPSGSATTLTYGPRGDVTQTGGPTGTIVHTRDHARRRWLRNNATTTGATRFSYDASGRLVEQRTSFSSGTTERDEYIYIGNTPVGVTHTDNNFPSPRSWYLSPDAMGTPRRVFDRSGSTVTQVSRLVMFPWGNAACVPNPGAGVLCKGQQTSELQGISAAVPSLPFRLPGQIADEDTGLSENGYRVYAPVLGQYLQPDPLYGTTAQAGVGPQAYAYANGNPLKYSDPRGLFSLVDASGCEGSYPVLYRVVSQEMPYNGLDPEYRKIFNDMFGSGGIFSSSGAQLLEKGCKWRSGPTIMVGNAHKNYAETAGDRIVIRRSLVERIEKNPSESWFLHVVLLHELAHWANAESGATWDVEPSEAGDEFERRAYGAVYQLPGFTK